MEKLGGSKLQNLTVVDSIKKLLGIDKDDDYFDVEILTHINTVMLNLSQIGLGDYDTLICSEETTWDNLNVEQVVNHRTLETYIYLRVKLIFDPPQSSMVADSFKSIIAEYEWRINHEIEKSKCKEGDKDER